MKESKDKTVIFLHPNFEEYEHIFTGFEMGEIHVDQYLMIPYGLVQEEMNGLFQFMGDMRGDKYIAYASSGYHGQNMLELYCKKYYGALEEIEELNEKIAKWKVAYQDQLSVTLKEIKKNEQ